MDSNATPVWEPVVWALIYTTQFERLLDDALADRRAKALILEPLHGLSPEQEHEALRRALESRSSLREILPVGPHTDDDLRDFTRRVFEHMEARRPWPQLPFITLAQPLWPDFEDCHVIARIRMSSGRVTERIRSHFSHLDHRGKALYWLLLRLNSGDEVALVEPWWPGSEHVAVLMRPESGRDPRDVLAAFLHVTGFILDEVDDLTEGVNPLSRGGAGSGWLEYTMRRATVSATPGSVSYEVFLRSRLYCQAGERPGVVAVGPAGEGLVPAFTSPEALARHTGGGNFFSTIGRDLLDLLPDGYGVLVDPGTEYAAVFDREGPR